MRGVPWTWLSILVIGQGSRGDPRLLYMIFLHPFFQMIQCETGPFHGLTVVPVVWMRLRVRNPWCHHDSSRHDDSQGHIRVFTSGYPIAEQSIPCGNPFSNTRNDIYRMFQPALHISFSILPRSLSCSFQYGC